VHAVTGGTRNLFFSLNELMAVNMAKLIAKLTAAA